MTTFTIHMTISLTFSQAALNSIISTSKLKLLPAMMYINIMHLFYANITSFCARFPRTCMPISISSTLGKFSFTWIISLLLLPSSASTDTQYHPLANSYLAINYVLTLKNTKALSYKDPSFPVLSMV